MTKDETDLQQQTEEESSFDWKKSGFDFQERLTLKHNTLAAEQYRAKQNQKEQKKILQKPTKILPLGKIPAKIKDALDEDDEENGTYVPIRLLEDEHLMYQSLNEAEKNLFMQKNTLKQTNMQQETGRLEALRTANKLVKDMGLVAVSRKAAAQSLQQTVYDPEKMKKNLVQKEARQHFSLKGKVQGEKIKPFVKGVRQIQQTAGDKALKELDVKDIVRVGERKTDEKSIAELILEKSGQDIQKTKLKKKVAKTQKTNKTQQEQRPTKPMAQRDDNLSR